MIAVASCGEIFLRSSREPTAKIAWSTGMLLYMSDASAVTKYTSPSSGSENVRSLVTIDAVLGSTVSQVSSTLFRVVS